MTTTLSFKIRSIKNQIAACLREIEKGVKWFVVQLIDLEEKLEAAMSKQFSEFSEAQIREAFKKAAGDFRYWKPEMVEIIPALVGLPLTNHDSWEHWSKFEPIQKAEAFGWKDRAIALSIDAAAQLQSPSA